MATAAKQMADRNVSWSTKMTIGGLQIEGDGSRLAVENPATEETLATVRQASLAQVDEAVRAARRAFDCGVWANAAQRRRVLLQFADLI
jgi:acyl-CoA reductase-like NAD-dependent aldehyde dehydrogenase